MKKVFMVLAATFICGACLFTSCKKDEDNNNSNVAEKIMGRWITASVDGQALPTNEKKVYNFISTTECYFSASLNPDGAQWIALHEADVAINGNKVTLTHRTEANQTVLEEFTITAINENEFTANMHVKII